MLRLLIIPRSTPVATTRARAVCRYYKLLESPTSICITMETVVSVAQEAKQTKEKQKSKGEKRRGSRAESDRRKRSLKRATQSS